MKFYIFIGLLFVSKQSMKLVEKKRNLGKHSGDRESDKQLLLNAHYFLNSVRSHPLISLEKIFDLGNVISIETNLVPSDVLDQTTVMKIAGWANLEVSSDGRVYLNLTRPKIIFPLFLWALFYLLWALLTWTSKDVFVSFIRYFIELCQNAYLFIELFGSL